MKRLISLALVACCGCLSSCTYGGSLKTFSEYFGLGNYGKKPPGVHVKETLLSKEMTVTSEGEATVEQLDYTPQDKAVHLKGLHLSSNPTPVVKTISEMATANAKEYDVYAATHSHESDNQTSEVIAGIQAGQALGTAALPLLAKGPASPASKSGILSGILGAGVDPQAILGLLSDVTGIPVLNPKLSKLDQATGLFGAMTPAEKSELISRLTGQPPK